MKETHVSCAVATASGFAMPYSPRLGAHSHESAVYRQKPASKRSRRRLPNAISNRPGAAAPSVTRS
jgi:hypothetical protein